MHHDVVSPHLNRSIAELLNATLKNATWLNATGLRTQEHGFLASLTITHLPNGSPALWVSVICMILFTLIHLSLVRNEWVVYCRLRHEWLLRRVDDHAENVGGYASLVKVGTPISTNAICYIRYLRHTCYRWARPSQPTRSRCGCAASFPVKSTRWCPSRSRG